VLLAVCGAALQQPAPQSADHPEAPKKLERLRPPAVAGLFYPGQRKELSQLIDSLLANSETVQLGKLRGLICPHAGYEFSGSVAAVGYKQLLGRDLRTVVILGPSHYARFTGTAIPNNDGFTTPLGNARIAQWMGNLTQNKDFNVDPPCEVDRPGFWPQTGIDVHGLKDTPHTWEHSVEVQVPFVQRVLPQAEIVPLVISADADPAAAARVLGEHLDEHTLLLASSDLSHYDPYETANRKDTACTAAICSLDIESMQRQEACGKQPILVLMHLARQKHWKATLLKQCNSGDTTANKSRVVGYAAIAFCEPEFAHQDRKRLLELARTTIKKAVHGDELAEPSAAETPAEFAEQRACFVTLREGGQLRGCIGSIFPQEPLYSGVIHMARNAALNDFRFRPVRPEEVDHLEIEVSVLTVPRPLSFSSPKELLDKLRPGVDGVVLRFGPKEATFLPQVWAELPDKEQFLTHLSEKANLFPSAWKTTEAKVMVYQVEAFQEKEER
jgi:AmmeMemoRadiSam system protein B/AmmeMemoRadiSam system protein A